MQILQLISRETTENLHVLIKQKERSLRGKGTTFFMKKRNVWHHEKYPGWINIKSLGKRIVVFEIQTRAEGKEWQLTQALVGYLNRHFSKDIEQLSIYFV